MKRQEWSLVRFKILQSTISKKGKTSAIEKRKGSTSQSKQRAEQKERTIFCSINCKF